MRTTITLDESVAKDLMRFSAERTRTAAVNHALAEWVRLKRIEQIKALRGALPIEGDLAELRRMEIAER